VLGCVGDHILQDFYTLLVTRLGKSLDHRKTETLSQQLAIPTTFILTSSLF
jgi:hypothetical protein